MVNVKPMKSRRKRGEVEKQAEKYETRKKEETWDELLEKDIGYISSLPKPCLDFQTVKLMGQPV